jgi:hypothetical protein
VTFGVMLTAIVAVVSGRIGFDANVDRANVTLWLSISKAGFWKPGSPRRGIWLRRSSFLSTS